MSEPASAPIPRVRAALTPLGGTCPAETTVIRNCLPDLAKALELKRWLENAPAGDPSFQKFELTQTEHERELSYGFFGKAPMPDGTVMPVMGNVQEMFFDHGRNFPGFVPGDWTELCRQVREFVLHYFMRVSSFMLPEPFVAPEDRDKRGWPSWCGAQSTGREGFGYTQYFAKPRDGEIARFAPNEKCRIVDLREIGKIWDYVIARLQFYDFQVGFYPVGGSGPEVAVDLKAANFIMLAPELVVDRQRPEKGVLAEYGIGYAAISNPVPSVIAYGPGHFEAAVEMMTWRVMETGEVRARLEFISNRPRRVTQVNADPVSVGFLVAKLATLGLASRLIDPLQRAWESVVPKLQIDPLSAAIAGVNAITQGKAARDYCISRDQLDKELLLLHFRQHYRAVQSSLRVWRRVPDWSDEAAIPEWIREGTAPH